jgi:hypothetical protein
VLDVLVPEVVLQSPGVVAIIGELKTTGMAQHVWVDGNGSCSAALINRPPIPPQYTSKSAGRKAGHAVAHVMAVSKVSAIARPIPTVASFSMYVPLLVLPDFAGDKIERV